MRVMDAFVSFIATRSLLSALNAERTAAQKIPDDDPYSAII